METIRNSISLATYVTFLALAASLLLPSPAAATMADDEKDCADQMTSLAACIPFVSGTAKQPTKECCDDTNKVKTTKPKCLCVLIKDSSDPSMGLPINTTLALQMPSACNIDAKVSDCPSLLNLPADSPDAKIFKVASSGDLSSEAPAAPDSAKSASSSTPATSSDSIAPKTESTSSSSDATMVVRSVLPVIGLAVISLV